MLQDTVPYHDPMFRLPPKSIEILNPPTAMRPMTKKADIDPKDLNLSDIEITRSWKKSLHMRRSLQKEVC